MDVGGVSFDTRGLSFLLEGHPEAVQRLLLERRRFNLAVQMIDGRSELGGPRLFRRSRAPA